MKAVSRNFKAYQVAKGRIINPGSFKGFKEEDKFEYPDVGDYKGRATCLNLITEGEMIGRCFEDYHHCAGRTNCPYSPKEAIPVVRSMYDVPDMDEIYDFHSHLPIPYIEPVKAKNNVVSHSELATLTHELKRVEEYVEKTEEALVAVKELDNSVPVVNPVKLRNRHGCSKHPLYQKWKNMCNSCYEETDPAYAKIGAKGIRVCERWHDIRNFIEDFPHYRANSSMRFKRLDKFKDFQPGNLVLN